MTLRRLAKRPQDGPVLPAHSSGRRSDSGTSQSLPNHLTLQFTVSKEVADEAKAFAKAGKDASATKSALASITNGASKMAISPVSPPALQKVMAPRSVERVAPPPASALNSPSPSPSPLPSAGEDVSYEEAIRRREAKELEDAKLLCSLENKCVIACRPGSR